MSDFTFGLVHAPLTPFDADGVDYTAYGKVLDFHLGHGADGLAIPTHTGESVSLTVAERKQLLEFAIRRVAGRAYVVANVSEAGSAIACDLAAHARAVGAAALIASVPYYWTPPQSMLVEHFAAIAAAGQLPLFVLNAPEEMNNVEVKASSVVELLARAPYFAGLIDASLDWQYMIEVASSGRAARADFQFVSGTEYMISASATGATGMLSSLAVLAPRLVRELFDLCRGEHYKDARGLQEDAAILYRAIVKEGVPGLKAASGLLGRDCGQPRPPLPALEGTARETVAQAIASVKRIETEPKGWA